MEPIYIIQTRRKGAWQRYIGTSDRATIDKCWANMHSNGARRAARMIETTDGKRIKIIAKMKHIAHERRG
jgi:hypothetical protein